ncbi:MAG: TetR/AcrR family transcriptional regulator [Bradymonadaceae bacterium]|nr:TetR/AcrR family transcriptional regulator [Lujinxingiaceae bacterium]
MARPSTITDEQILDAAREVFFREGIQATTAEIAQVAGVSEGTIFRRFPTKHELFLAAMGLESGPGWIATVERLVASEERGDLRENLTLIAEEMLDFFNQLIPKMNMLMSCGKGAGPAAMFDSDVQPPPILGLKALMKYLMAEQGAGRIEVSDPEILARMFMGSLHHYAFWEFCGLNRMLPMPRPTFVRCVVDTLVRSVTPALS